MKFQIGDIISYSDPLFNERSYVYSYFVVANIVDDMYYYMLPLNDVYDDFNEQYLISWVDDSSRWKRVS